MVLETTPEFIRALLLSQSGSHFNGFINYFRGDCKIIEQ